MEVEKTPQDVIKELEFIYDLRLQKLRGIAAEKDRDVATLSDRLARLKEDFKFNLDIIEEQQGALSTSESRFNQLQTVLCQQSTEHAETQSQLATTIRMLDAAKQAAADTESKMQAQVLVGAASVHMPSPGPTSDAPKEMQDRHEGEQAAVLQDLRENQRQLDELRNVLRQQRAAHEAECTKIRGLVAAESAAEAQARCADREGELLEQLSEGKARLDEEAAARAKAQNQVASVQAQLEEAQQSGKVQQAASQTQSETCQAQELLAKDTISTLQAQLQLCQHQAQQRETQQAEQIQELASALLDTRFNSEKNEGKWQAQQDQYRLEILQNQQRLASLESAPSNTAPHPPCDTHHDQEVRQSSAGPGQPLVDAPLAHAEMQQQVLELQQELAKHQKYAEQVSALQAALKASQEQGDAAQATYMSTLNGQQEELQRLRIKLDRGQRHAYGKQNDMLISLDDPLAETPLKSMGHLGGDDDLAIDEFKPASPIISPALSDRRLPSEAPLMPVDPAVLAQIKEELDRATHDLEVQAQKQQEYQLMLEQKSQKYRRLKAESKTIIRSLQNQLYQLQAGHGDHQQFHHNADGSALINKKLFEDNKHLVAQLADAAEDIRKLIAQRDKLISISNMQRAELSKQQPAPVDLLEHQSCVMDAYPSTSLPAALQSLNLGKLQSSAAVPISLLVSETAPNPAGHGSRRASGSSLHVQGQNIRSGSKREMKHMVCSFDFSDCRIFVSVEAQFTDFFI
eukprot:gene5094-127_t